MEPIQQIATFDPPAVGGNENKAQLKLNRNLREIFKDKRNDNLLIISICGPKESGKSFLMNYILRHLKGRSESPEFDDEDPLGWSLPDTPDAPLEGFAWGEDKKKTAPAAQGTGIWLTTEPLMLKSNENQVSVYLMDTEFATEMESNAVIEFCLRVSNIVIFNSPYEVPASFLSNLGSALAEITPATNELILAVRDWEQNGGLQFGEAGGQLLKQELFNPAQPNTDASQIQSKINNIACFLLPHPGDKSQQPGFNGKLASLSPKFATILEQFLLFAFQGDQLFQAKPRKLQEIIKSCTPYFQKIPAPAAGPSKPDNRSPDELNRGIWQKIAADFEKAVKAEYRQQTLSMRSLTKVQQKCEKIAFHAFQSAKLYGADDAKQRAEDALWSRIAAIRVKCNSENDQNLKFVRGKLLESKDHEMDYYNKHLDLIFKHTSNLQLVVINPRVEELQNRVKKHFREFVNTKYNFHENLVQESATKLTAEMESKFKAKLDEAQQKGQSKAKEKVQWAICRAKAETEYKNEMKQVIKPGHCYSTKKLETWHFLFSEKIKLLVELPTNGDYAKQMEECLQKLFDDILKNNMKEKDAFMAKLDNKMEISLALYMSRMKDVLNNHPVPTSESVEKNSQNAKEEAVMLFKQDVLKSVDSDDEQIMEDILTSFDARMLKSEEEIKQAFQAATKIRKTSIISQALDKFRTKIKSFREANPFAGLTAIERTRMEFEKEWKAPNMNEGTGPELCGEVEKAIKAEVDKIRKEIEENLEKQRKIAQGLVQELIFTYGQNAANGFLEPYESILDLHQFQIKKLKSCEDEFKSKCQIKDEVFITEFITDLDAKLQEKFILERNDLAERLQREETLIGQKIGLELITYKEDMKTFLKSKEFHLPADFLRKHQELVKNTIINIGVPRMTRNGKDKVKGLLRPHYEKYKERNDLNTPVENPAIGIDLGTTYCCVAVYQKGKLEVINTADHKSVIPSYVGLHPQEELVGEIAKIRAHEYPADTIFDAKRLIGREFSDPIVQADIKLWPFKVCKKSGTADTPVIHGKGQQYEPEQISAKLLSHLKKLAEKHLGKKVEKAVITVPAYFNDGQRQATIDAGEIAGLEVLQILNEPTAAAIAYYLHQASGYGTAQKSKNILVYDLGGGTFDVSVLTIAGNGEIIVRAVNGDTHLGGEDFDNKMVEFCVEKFYKLKSYDLTQEDGRRPGMFSHMQSMLLRQRQQEHERLRAMYNSPSSTNSLGQVPRRLRRIRNACEDVKKNLSWTESAAVILDAIFIGEDMNIPITRKEFEGMNQSQFDQTIEIVRKALVDAKLAKHEIDEVVLVGGSTRIPKIRKMVEDFFNGKSLIDYIDADLAVAHGAAVLAAKLNGLQEQKLKNISLNDVCPLSIGIQVLGGSLSVIVPRNTPLPTAKIASNYGTARDSQTSVDIIVYEGEQRMARANHLLGQFTLSNIPSARSGKESIAVKMELNEAGVLHVTATCASTGGQNQITINEQKGRLTRDEIKRLRAELVSF